MGGTLAGSLPDGKGAVPGTAGETTGTRAGKREKRMQRVFALQDDGTADGGKVHIPTNDGLLQREAAERAADGYAGRGAERQGSEVRQGNTGLLFLPYPAGTEKRIENVT